MSRRSFAVVICSYTERRWNDLCAAVDSVHRQLLPPRQTVVVVDDDEALYRRVRAGLPQVTAVLKRGGQGLSAARNAGVGATAEGIVAFLDDDAVANPNWLAVLAKHYADPEVLGVGGTVEPVFATGRPVWFPREFDWVVGCSYRGLPRRRGAGPELHRRQHVVPAGRLRRRRRVRRRAGPRRRRARRAATRPSSAFVSSSACRVAACCTSRAPSCATACPGFERAGHISGGAAGRRASRRRSSPARTADRARCPQSGPTRSGSCRGRSRAPSPRPPHGAIVGRSNVPAPSPAA